MEPKFALITSGKMTYVFLKKILQMRRKGLCRDE